MGRTFSCGVSNESERHAYIIYYVEIGTKLSLRIFRKNEKILGVALLKIIYVIFHFFFFCN